MIVYENTMSFIQRWKTPMCPKDLSEVYKALKTKGYFSFDYNKNIEDKYRITIMSNILSIPGFKKFIYDIVDEQYQISKVASSSQHYLWIMYKSGAKAGQYRPFILMAEMNLLKEMGYINDQQIENILKMIDSNDLDNFNIAFLALKNMREQRLKDHGVFSKASFPYQGIVEDYLTKILTLEIFEKQGL
jgi:hypothetical protein